MNSLQSIRSIAGAKAFTEFSWEGAQARRFNLIYGWNRAGKTTISRILSFFEHKSIHLDGFEGVRFRVQLKDGFATEKDVAGGQMEVRVFDEDFVRKNLLFHDSVANPIVILGEKSVEIEKEIKELEARIADSDQRRATLQEDLDNIPDVSKILTDCGTAVVNVFAGTPLATDQYYGRRYNRRKVQELLDNSVVTEESLESHVVGTNSELETLKQQVASTHSEVSFEEPMLGPLREAFRKGNALLKRTVTVSAIQELDDDDELRRWVKEGHRLHDARNHSTCYFCTNPLPQGLLARYAAFFTEEVAKVEADIGNVVKQLEEAEQQIQKDLPDSGLFYPDLASKYLSMRSQLEEATTAVLKACQSLRRGLESRRGRVQIAGSEGEEVTFPKDDAQIAEEGVEELTRLCGIQATRLENGEQEVKKAGRQLELHTVASLLFQRDYFQQVNARRGLETDLRRLDQTVQEAQAEIRKKQAALKDMALAVEEINSLIAGFLGPDEIVLTFTSDAEERGYQITSRGEPSRYLSEGEKSVVALSYFLVSLREEGGEPENTIVVLDDPVDSQDSLFLFRTYGLLKRRLNKAGQLLILTHNHEFFNLFRDWLTSKTNFEDSRLYWVEMRRENENRRTVVKDLPVLLRDHKSEYQYLFYRLLAHRDDKEKLDGPLIPNVARKVLETFAAFKWSCPTSTALSNIIFNLFIKGPNERGSGVGDTVLKFINEYSHGQDFDRPVSSATFEADSICEAVLEFIRISDRDHYNHLVKSIPRPSA